MSLFEVRQSLRDIVNFKTARWTCDRCPKINKSPTVSNGVRPSSFEIWTANLVQLLTMSTLTNSKSFIFGDSNWKFCEVGYPIGTQKPNIQINIFQIWDYYFILFLVRKKNLNLLDIQEHCIHKLGKIRSALKLLFGVYYWFLKLHTVGTLTNSRSFIFGDSNWKFSKIGYPIGPQKPDIQMWTFLITSSFFNAFIF